MNGKGYNGGRNTEPEKEIKTSNAKPYYNGGINIQYEPIDISKNSSKSNDSFWDGSSSNSNTSNSKETDKSSYAAEIEKRNENEKKGTALLNKGISELNNGNNLQAITYFNQAETYGKDVSYYKRKANARIAAKKRDEEFNGKIEASKQNMENINNASDAASREWQQGNYIEGAQHLANEYAKQGHTDAVVGTVILGGAMEIGAAFNRNRQARLERERIAEEEATRQRKIREENERIRIAEEKERKRIEQLELERKAELERQRLAKITRQEIFMKNLKDNDLPFIVNQKNSYAYAIYKLYTTEIIIYRLDFNSVNNQLPYKKDVIQKLKETINKKQTGFGENRLFIGEVNSSEQDRDRIVESYKGKAFSSDIEVIVSEETLTFGSDIESKKNTETDFWGSEKKKSRTNNNFWD